VEDVATPEAWRRDPELVLDFYKLRRRQLSTVEPNAAHRALADLEAFCEVAIITQNVDNLHERGGSTQVIHLHGELDMARCVHDDAALFPLNGKDIQMGDLAEDGGPLRPHVVWFGEAVPEIARAVEVIGRADILIVVGTSLQVYPAAGLVDYAPASVEGYLIDPGLASGLSLPPSFTGYAEAATVAMPRLVERLRRSSSASES
jgi:NAD-dependent deacetylase